MNTTSCPARMNPAPNALPSAPAPTIATLTPAPSRCPGRRRSTRESRLSQSRTPTSASVRSISSANVAQDPRRPPRRRWRGRRARATDQARPGAERERLDHVAAAAHPPRAAPAHGRRLRRRPPGACRSWPGRRRAGGRRGWRRRRLAAGRDREGRILAAHHALEHQRPAPGLADPAQVVPADVGVEQPLHEAVSRSPPVTPPGRSEAS